MESQDRISLALPCKAEYVSTARLTVSGITSRIGFDIETVEDIKVAVSEVCSRIICAAGAPDRRYEIIFNIFADKLKITFTSDIESIGSIFENDSTGLGVSIINAFMDVVEFCPENGNYILSMTKKYEVVSRDG